jgi:hypothetical protein
MPGFIAWRLRPLITQNYSQYLLFLALLSKKDYFNPQWKFVIVIEKFPGLD